MLVVEIDGSMVPVVEYGELGGEQKASGLKRNRNCFWKEFRLCTASRPEGSETRYAVTDGSPFEAGCMMYRNCQLEGMDEATHIHGVADGAHGSLTNMRSSSGRTMASSSIFTMSVNTLPQPPTNSMRTRQEGGTGMRGKGGT